MKKSITIKLLHQMFIIITYFDVCIYFASVRLSVKKKNFWKDFALLSIKGFLNVFALFIE